MFFHLVYFLHINPAISLHILRGEVRAMKRFLIIAACIMALAGPAQANDFQFDGLYLWGSDYNAWDTTGGFPPNWILGVSLQPNDPLVQSVGGRALPNPLGSGVYYLYAADQVLGNLGNQYSGLVYIRLYQGSETFTANFVRSGTPGQFELWADDWRGTSHTAGFVGTPEIHLGWAQGTADKVDNVATNTGVGNSEADWYLVLGVNVKPVLAPLPGAAWLFSSVLLPWAVLRRIKKKI